MSDGGVGTGDWGLDWGWVLSFNDRVATGVPPVDSREWWSVGVLE
jgi:hypothetical protein